MIIAEVSEHKIGFKSSVRRLARHALPCRQRPYSDRCARRPAAAAGGGTVRCMAWRPPLLLLLLCSSKYTYVRTTTSDVGLLSYSVQAGSIVPLQLVRRLPHLMRAEPCQRHRRRARRAASVAPRRVGGAAVCSAVVLERTNGLCSSFPSACRPLALSCSAASGFKESERRR